MGSTKHEKSFVDFDKPYEQNLIGLRGVVYFAVGLFLLIVVTFGLLWALQNVMEDQAAETDRLNARPMAITDDRERLPPEPRLQAAPGFGVESQNGRVNLELRAPQSEYRELHKQWEQIWENGQTVVDQNNNQTAVTLPIEEAKKRMLESAPKTRDAAEAEKALEEGSTFVSYSSAGRTRTDRRR
jgi:hypothetical protein